VAGSSLGGRGSRAPISGINVTPMVDVVLVLLVIMMVSANYIVSQSMNVDLPKAARGDRATATPALVSVGKDGALGWNDERVTAEQLSERLRSTHSENPDVNLLVSADTAARHGDVVHVLDLAKAVGITHFAISVEQGD
jgi:biopolymer transport protein ExbD